MKNFTSFMLLIFFCLGCQSNKDRIEGKWNVIIWEENGDIDQEMSSIIDFDSDGTALMRKNSLLFRAEWFTYNSDSIALISEGDTLKGEFKFVDEKLKIEGGVNEESYYMELVKLENQ